MENRHCSTFCDRDPPICGDGNADLPGRLSVALSCADADTRDGGFRKCKLRYGLLAPVPADRRGCMFCTPLWYQLPAFVLCIVPVGVMAGLLCGLRPSSVQRTTTMAGRWLT